MIRQTSAEAFHEMKRSGLLSKSRQAVYDALYFYGPATASQIAAKLEVRVKGSVCARLTELRDRGCAAELSEVKCPISGMTTILWDVTSSLPVEPKKKKTKLQLTLEKEREECARIAESFSSIAAVMIRNRNDTGKTN